MAQPRGAGMRSERELTRQAEWEGEMHSLLPDLNRETDVMEEREGSCGFDVQSPQSANHGKVSGCLTVR
jgi:hypothetical protein